ncbi:hypothetical protein [Candidatus Thiodiazotropha sp. CDECU1]|uniref:hypothetical protein n=1 Tax=Candidatus Thiodiazotropha sp. CDECU1 TaxID=3065865 RepID=UPI0029311E40|nr:hypothetical protein [Candidatus Thiodiazotropha sp. CDECU1]
MVPVAGQDWSSDPFSVLEKDGRLFTSVMSSLIEQAVEFQREQHRHYQKKVAIALNLSVRLLNDTGFRKQLFEHLIAQDFLPDSLIIEITEDNVLCCG